MKLSVVIPTRNEEECIAGTIDALQRHLASEGIEEYEILVVNDGSTDGTEEVLRAVTAASSNVRHLNNRAPNGFGFAVRKGLEEFTGDAVAVYMADASDRPEDLVKFYRAMVRHDLDCVFGSRFSPSARVVNYPWPKLLLNRAANTFVQVAFGLRYNDITNAFKLYRRHVIDGVQPLLSHHFNLTVELPLKAIVRGYSYTVLPNDWVNRKAGVSKLRIKEMGSRYLFIVLYCFIEKWLSRGDYHRKSGQGADTPEASREMVGS